MKVMLMLNAYSPTTELTRLVERHFFDIDDNEQTQTAMELVSKFLQHDESNGVITFLDLKNDDQPTVSMIPMD